MRTGKDKTGPRAPLKFLQRLNPLRSRQVPPVPEKRQSSPECTAGFFSLLTFSWMSSIMTVGYQRPLELNDIWSLNPDRSTHLVAARLNEAFRDNHRQGVKRPLLKAMVRTFRTDLVIGGTAAFVANVSQVLIPFVMKYIINFAVREYYAESRGVSAPAIGEGVGLVLAMVIMQIMSSIGNNHFFYRGMILGGQLRSALISLIFDKAMSISGRAKAGRSPLAPPQEGVKPESDEEKEHYQHQLQTDGNEKEMKKGAKPAEGWNNGRIVNLMSVDTYRIDQASGWLHLVWTSPLSTIITIVLLLINLTYSAVVGIVLFFLSVPIMAFCARAMFKRRKAINKLTDQRVSMMQEILQSIRFVKYYAWEGYFMKRLGQIRQREIHSVRLLLTTRNAITVVGSGILILASMLTFITFSLTNHALEPGPVFSSLALFNQLRMPLAIYPMVIGLVMDALQSIARIEKFLLAEDAPDVMSVENGAGIALDLRDASFTWEQSSPSDPTEGVANGAGRVANLREAKIKEKEAKVERKKKAKEIKKQREAGAGSAGEVTEPSGPTPEATPFTLNDINLQVRPGELIAVIGGVGSGKSSLLSAIVGDMRRTAGSSTLNGKVALCAQLAWIQNATVRDNITFGGEYNAIKYNRVIEACALDHDVKILPHGSSTEIGERGINLSGGQKHRVSLARAIYFDADVILLDDPLAAVDAHVGAHIMENAICGLLKDKCRVLATHQLHVLPRCDRIIMMGEGRIVACGTFEELIAENEAFQALMTSIDRDERSRSENQNDTKPEHVVEHTPTELDQISLMQQEERQVHGIKWSVYANFWRSSGSLLVPILIILCLAVAQGANIFTNLWLAWWSDNKFHMATGVYIGIYGALGISQALLVFGFSMSLSIFGTEAGKRMLYHATENILRAPASFFDTTPLGRIMNRFSKDIDVMDNNLTESMRMAGISAATVMSVLILVIAYYYYFAVAMVPLFIIYLFTSAYYRVSARELKRHEAVLRSSVFSLFNEAVVGTSTIRAYRVQHTFSRKLKDAIDNMDSAYYLTFANQRWMCVRLDFIGVVFLVVTGMLVVTNRFSVSPSISGLVLSYLVSITQVMQLAVRQVADVENHMNAVERLHYYGTSLPQESTKDTPGGPIIPESWPSRGEISFKDVQMQYRPKLPLVLHGLNLEIRPGERIGIVGRTGAGKSSIAAALFRLVELSGGTISIDGIDIASVPLATLRSRMAIIPQDPVIFRGTVRSNLDPFDQHTDLDLWGALRSAHLVDSIEPATVVPGPVGRSGERLTLDTSIEPDGANLSQGQRQLLALARVLVRGARVVICDEATSSIDYESDRAVQEALTHTFKGCTLVCIAHRLRTIIGYDRVCVMDDGKVVEIDEPVRLFGAGGMFSRMCERSQIGIEEILEARGVNIEI